MHWWKCIFGHICSQTFVDISICFECIVIEAIGEISGDCEVDHQYTSWNWCKAVVTSPSIFTVRISSYWWQLGNQFEMEPVSRRSWTLNRVTDIDALIWWCQKVKRFDLVSARVPFTVNWRQSVLMAIFLVNLNYLVDAFICFFHLSLEKNFRGFASLQYSPRMTWSFYFKWAE